MLLCFFLLQHIDHYSRTKAIAEQMVLSANGCSLKGVKRSACAMTSVAFSYNMKTLQSEETETYSFLFLSQCVCMFERELEAVVAMETHPPMCAIQHTSLNIDLAEQIEAFT